MDAFEFTTTLFAIVLALGIARILGGFADLIRRWYAVEHAPLFLIWFLFLLLVHIGWWFSIWQIHEQQVFPFSYFIRLFAVPVFLFMATRLLIPAEGEFTHIYERFTIVRRSFMLCLLIPLGLLPLMFLLVTQRFSLGFAYLLIMSSALVAGALSNNIRVHYAVGVVSCVVYFAFVVQYRTSIGA